MALNFASSLTKFVYQLNAGTLKGLRMQSVTMIEPTTHSKYLRRFSVQICLWIVKRKDLNLWPDFMMQTHGKYIV